MDIVRGAIINVFLLLGFVSVCSLIGGWLARRGFKLKTWFVGLLFGALAVVSMFSPVFILFWMMVDCRAGVIGTAALLGGLPVALVSLVFPCIYRIGVGGPGLLPGLCELVFAALLGSLCHEWFYRQKRQLTRSEILLASAFVGFGVDLLLAVSFMEHGLHIIHAVGTGGYLLLYFMIPVSMALLSSFVIRMQSYDRLLESANDSEQRMLRSQKMAAIGQLSHRIAHSVLNVLTIIMGNAEQAKAEARKINDENIPRYMDEIIDAVDRLAKLAGELVTFSSPWNLRFQQMDLSKCLVGVDQLVSKLIGSDVEVSIEGDREVGLVKVDPNLVEQIIVHLVINAAEAMSGGGRLTIKVSSCDLTRAERARLLSDIPRSEWHMGRFAVLSVHDTGCGMTEATAARVFEPFFTTKKKTENSGLGLSTVYNIVQKHGGVIDVKSEVNHGTTVLIYFPVIG